MNNAISVDFNHLSDDELTAIIANHKTMSSDYQRVDGRAFAASVVLQERQNKKSPGKQKFIKPA